MNITARLPVLYLAFGASILIGCGTAPRNREPETRGMITSADLENPNQPIEVILQRKVPGVIVSRSPDGGIALQIRGSSSFINSSTPPLFILNGAPFTPGAGGSLTGINPYDIESIRVLTTAQSAIWGVQGADGVIEIKTKMPGKDAGTRP